ncbi:MAG TPA: hypothetical protein VGS97_28580 [Actinocrinis sp.]|uniref:hypothetical protein n=1 Tax=Actinocrinis sp. TaxID=1920516 RepID=UPI002DDC8FFF|nr:hypothetical protein [Actinocrinis sp.]HEV2348077.1 hypothetical protein [Actinocrinis sp.]
MYTWGFVADDEEAAALLDTLPVEALLAFQELMTAVELDPWGIAGKSPGEPNMPNVLFGPHGEGQVSYLILDGPREVWVTRVQWAD